MNKNLYHWHAEQMVKIEKQAAYHVAEQARLLREAGLSGPSLVTRATKGLGNLLNASRTRVRDQNSLEHESYSFIRKLGEEPEKALFPHKGWLDQGANIRSPSSRDLILLERNFLGQDNQLSISCKNAILFKRFAECHAYNLIRIYCL